MLSSKSISSVSVSFSIILPSSCNDNSFTASVAADPSTASVDDGLCTASDGGDGPSSGKVSPFFPSTLEMAATAFACNISVGGDGFDDDSSPALGIVFGSLWGD